MTIWLLVLCYACLHSLAAGLVNQQSGAVASRRVHKCFGEFPRLHLGGQRFGDLELIQKGWEMLGYYIYNIYIYIYYMYIDIRHMIHDHDIHIVTH